MSHVWTNLPGFDFKYPIDSTPVQNAESAVADRSANKTERVVPLVLFHRRIKFPRYEFVVVYLCAVCDTFISHNHQVYHVHHICIIDDFHR